MFEPKIKVCGITNLEDAKYVVDMGADILGFIFYEGSPRYVSPEVVAEIVPQLPTVTGVAGVFVNETFDNIRDIIEKCQLNWVQLHGDETPEFCEELKYLNVRTIKAIRVKGIEDLESVNKYPTDAVLLEGYTQGKFGGTGKRFDWDMLRSVIAYLDKRIIISGGVNDENVREAYEMGLYGIDLCSSVEAEPGKKDYEKLKKFFETLRS